MEQPLESLDAIVDECVSQVIKGQATVSSCLRRYPGLAEELRSILEAALTMNSVPQPVLAAEARARLRAQVMDAVKPRRRIRAPRLPSFRTCRWVLVATGVIIIIAVLAIVVSRASEQGWLPAPARAVQAPGGGAGSAPVDEQETRRRLAAARQHLDDIQAKARAGRMDLRAVEALTDETEVILTALEHLPAAEARPLLQELMALLDEQDRTISALIGSAPKGAQNGLQTAVATTHGQADRAASLAESLSGDGRGGTPLAPDTAVPDGDTKSAAPPGKAKPTDAPLAAPDPAKTATERGPAHPVKASGTPHRVKTADAPRATHAPDMPRPAEQPKATKTPKAETPGKSRKP